METTTRARVCCLPPRVQEILIDRQCRAADAQQHGAHQQLQAVSVTFTVALDGYTQTC